MNKHTCVNSFTEHSGDVYSVKFHPGDVSIINNGIDINLIIDYNFNIIYKRIIL